MPWVRDLGLVIGHCACACACVLVLVFDHCVLALLWLEDWSLVFEHCVWSWSLGFDPCACACALVRRLAFGLVVVFGACFGLEL